MTSTKARRRSPAERRDEIAAAARVLAARDGLTALTLRGVAAEVGVASGLVAHYEPSMEALVARAFAEVAGAELAEVEALLAGATPADPGGTADAGRAVDPAVRGLTFLLTTLLDPGRDAVSSLWADAWSLGRRSPALAEAARTLMDSWNALALALIEDGVASGAFRTASADAVALQLFALVDSTTAYALVGYRTADERDAMVRSAVAASLGLPASALAPPTGRSPR